MKKQYSDLPMMAMPIIIRYLPGIILEKTNDEFIFSRGSHNVAITHLDERCFYRDERHIALDVINGIIRLELKS